jgi:hypothetical protein
MVLTRSGAHRHPVLAVLAFLFAGASGLVYRLDQSGRTEAERLLASAGLTNAASVETIAVLEAADVARAFAVEVTLAELAPGGDATAVSVRRGVDTRGTLKAAEKLAVAAVGGRPGSAHHRMLLAESAYALWDLDPKPGADSTKAWRGAFQAAGEGAPGFELIATAGANTILAAWPRLSPTDREASLPELRHCFESRGCARRVLPAAWQRLGAQSLDLLPDDPETLAQAATWLRAMGQQGAAGAIDRRREGHARP